MQLGSKHQLVCPSTYILVRVYTDFHDNMNHTYKLRLLTEEHKYHKRYTAMK